VYSLFINDGCFLLAILYPCLSFDGACRTVLPCSSPLLYAFSFPCTFASSSLSSPPLLWFRPVTLRLTCFFWTSPFASPPSSLPWPASAVRLATSRYSTLYLFLLSYPSQLAFSARLLLPLSPFYPTSSPAASSPPLKVFAQSGSAQCGYTLRTCDPKVDAADHWLLYYIVSLFTNAFVL